MRITDLIIQLSFKATAAWDTVRARSSREKNVIFNPEEELEAQEAVRAMLTLSSWATPWVMKEKKGPRCPGLPHLTKWRGQGGHMASVLQIHVCQ
jgi:hypothetical protein